MISVSDDERVTRTWEAGLFDRLMRDVHAMPSFEASRPVKIAPIDEPNVFEQPRLPTDPPPPWSTAAAAPTVLVRPKAPARQGGSWLSVLLAATIGASVMLVAIHPPARASVERAFERVVQTVKHRV